jgi:hypothetical protein
MNKCIKLTGFSLNMPSLNGDTDKNEYECYVQFSSYRDHIPLITKYFAWYHNLDVEKMTPLDRMGLVDDLQCARAITVFSFSEIFSQQIKLSTCEYTSKNNIPDSPPTKSSDGYSIWIIKTNANSINTEASAACKLRDACQHCKITVAEARFLVQQEFPQNQFSWDKILIQFSKLGGRHTKLYLRMPDRD